MENVELDVALEELENRLERLRALYEQYFMGIERIEPAIPRKDIDRRIYVLRREKIRNTAKRFKLQTIISRYNTFQQYWQRICREIEHGTYKRHVIKAERIAPGQLLTIAARKRLGRHAFDEVPADEPAPRAAPSSAPPNTPEATALASDAPTPKGDLRPAQATTTGKAVPPPKPVPPAKPGAQSAKPAPAPVREPAARAFESLDLDMDFMRDWDPTAASAKAKDTPVPATPERSFGQALARPLGAGSGVGVPKAAAAPEARPAAPKPGVPALPKPVATSSAGVATRPAAPPAVSAPAPAKPAPAAAAPKPPTQGAAEQRPIAPESAGIAPAAKLGAAPVAAKIAPKPGAAPAPAALTDARVRELHARLVEAKLQTKDAAAVSVEGLAKSLKATEAKLREQHKNRKIDFDVVIKDGKAVLKPIVR